ncbi:MAG: AAA family ATPase [Polyangiaceae bacterium]|nr:AAA family ATPase [Polyangiaceae bacterium]
MHPPPSTDGSIEQFLRAAIHAAGAVAKLHQSGTIHQNINPQTLRIDPRGQGVELTNAESNLSSTRPVLALPIEALPYMAPEQTGRLEGAVDHRADLYSLGVVLYELRAGTLPFHADDPLGWVHCHVARTPRPLAEAAPATPPIVADIVMKLLAKSPDERYQSARGATYDLERCLAALLAEGRIEPFPLGSQDVWDKLQTATRMYGRREELVTLRAGLERVRATGAVEVVLVTGPSGIGKTALLREVQRDAGLPFLWGELELQERGVPYAALGRAFRDLSRRIVASTDAEIAALRAQLADALGDNARLVMDLVPQLELVLGEPPAVPALSPADARNRFHATLLSFFRVLTSREHPLVLCLDNLQWADVASMELLQHVLTQPDVRNLHVIGIYRDEEVDASHPVTAALDEIRRAGVPITSVEIGPLSQEQVVELVLDMFRCERAQAEHLAALLWTKTSGNPFFAAQLLRALNQEQLIRFDARAWMWRWDIAELEAKEITDDLVELVLGKLRRLTEASLDVLKIAACIGSEFSVRLLGTLCGKAPEEVRKALLPALTEGLLLHRPEGYKFLHDRVLQAAYAMIPQDEVADLHLRLGWLLLEQAPEGATDGLIFEVVHQLNRGAARAATEGEQRRIAELNLRAGQKAKAAGAARSAATYLATGLSLLPGGGWGGDPRLAFRLHLALAECELLIGRFGEVERLCALLLEHAEARVDRASVHRILIQAAAAQADNARAVEIGLTCLRMFGIELPQSVGPEDARAEIVWVRDKLKELTLEELLALPEMGDPDLVAAAESLAALASTALYVKPDLAQLAFARIVRLSILHGNCPASIHGYVALAMVLCSVFGEFDIGYRLGKLACELEQRPGFNSGIAFSAAGGLVVIWSRPLREALEYLRIGFRRARDSGNPMFAAATLFHSVSDLLAMGEPLDAAHEATLPALEYAAGAKLAYMVDCFIICQRFISALREGSDRFGSMNAEGSGEEAFEAHLRERNIPLVRFIYHIYKLGARYLVHDYASAGAAADEAEDLRWSSLYSIVDAELCFYAGLTAAALFEGADEAERARLRGRMSAHEAQLRRWAESCPDNFGCRHALVAAEIARVERREHEASTLYDQAVRGARDSGFVQIQGLACELAGRFYLGRAFAILPGAYLREARDCYARWGAIGKVRQLDALHSDLIAAPRRESGPAQSAEAEPIDSLTAAKATAAISSEMAPDEVLATLMRILSEHAGAQRACLLVPSREGLSLAAEINSDRDDVQVDIPRTKRPISDATFPLPIAHYVRRTREKLILDDTAANAMFSTSAYVAGVRPKSMLCAPIVRRGEVAGIIYLENRLVRGAFTPRRLALLEFLSAISLENALLAADLARETAERTQAEETLRRSEERLARLLETANVVPWEADRETGRFTYVGPQAVKMLGYPPEAWLAADFLDERVDAEDRDRARLHLLAGDNDFDFRLRTAGGRTVWLHNVVSARPVDGSGVIGGFFFDVTERKEAERVLKEKLSIIEMQQEAIQRLSTPIMQVWEGVLTMPVLGAVDERRAEQMMSVVLDEVARTGSHHIIIDLTGVDSVDVRTADHIVRIVRAVQLLGATGIVVGIRAEVSSTIVSLGVDLSGIITLANLRQALVLCMAHRQGGRGGHAR